VHRDVSPHNILIGIGGQIKVADFGLAKAADGSGMEFADTPHGKYGYLSPEQARGQAVDRRSDVFSLGVVLYELTTGRRLFQGEDRHHTLGLVMQCKVPRPREVVNGYPPALEAIVLEALSNKPDERHQSADELRVALERYLVQERTLVSTGSVSALLKRVLGQRLQERREAINQALVATTGHANSDLLPEGSLLTGTSQSSEVTAPREHVSSFHPSASETPHAVSHSQTSMPALSSRSRRSTKRTIAIGGGAAAGVFVLMLGLGKMLQDEAAAVPTSGATTPESAKAEGTSTDSQERPRVEGLSVDDLPVEEQEERARQRRAVAAQPRPAVPAPPPAAKAPDWLKQAQDGSTPATQGEVAVAEADKPAQAPGGLPGSTTNTAAGEAPETKSGPAAPSGEPSTEDDTAKPDKVITNPYLKQPGF
jgi:serine/threonine protein kinase